MNAKETHILVDWLDNKSESLQNQAISEGFDVEAIDHHLDYIDNHAIKPDVDASWAAFHQRIANPTITAEKPRPTKKYLWLSLCLLALAGAAGYIWYSHQKTQEQREIKTIHQTEMAQVDQFKTPDYSKITVAPKSKASFYPHRWPAERQIWLEGKAYFEVAKGSTFDVITDQGMVTVLGTKFEVSLLDSSMAVTCMEGTVLVSAKSAKSQIIHNGQKLNLNGEKFGQVESHNLESITWKDKKLSFNAQSLTNVVKELSLYHSGKIDISSSLSKKRFSGVLPADNIDQAMSILTKTFGIKAVKDEKGNFLLQ